MDPEWSKKIESRKKEAEAFFAKRGLKPHPDLFVKSSSPISDKEKEQIVQQEKRMLENRALKQQPTNTLNRFVKGFKFSMGYAHAPRPIWYRFFATLLPASMWFWVMYRAKQDGPALLGLKHPWDH